MRNNLNTQRTIGFFRDKGFMIDIAERFIPVPPYGQRKDLFGFIDLIAAKPGIGIVGVQSCSAGALNEHYQKIMGRHRHAMKWLESGGKIYLIGWRKLVKKRGGKLKVWRPKLAVITMRHFNIENAKLFYHDWQELELAEF